MMMPMIWNNDLFDAFMDDMPQTMRHPEGLMSRDMMRTDITETETGYEMEIDLPGYERKEITAELKDGWLNVTAKKEQTEEDKRNFVHRERRVLDCTRRYRVGDAIDDTGITAAFANGVLRICLPKKQPLNEQRCIEIAG